MSQIIIVKQMYPLRYIKLIGPNSEEWTKWAYTHMAVVVVNAVTFFLFLNAFRFIILYESVTNKSEQMNLHVTIANSF